MDVGRQEKIRAVLDTNVLLGLAARPLLILARQNVFQIVWSDFIEAEAERVMGRLKWNPVNAAALLRAIDQMAERVDYQQITGGNYEEWLTDVDDHPIMATALMGRVDYIVTSNTKDFPPKKQFAGITIITPDAFLRLLES
ncbi:MAG TPA: PIN domain-containing protein [Anaerolineae bacterium]|nr:PIN domain-containing protein [Anaerolineae bacterium]